MCWQQLASEQQAPTTALQAKLQLCGFVKQLSSSCGMDLHMVAVAEGGAGWSKAVAEGCAGCTVLSMGWRVL